MKGSLIGQKIKMGVAHLSTMTGVHPADCLMKTLLKILKSCTSLHRSKALLPFIMKITCLSEIATSLRCSQLTSNYHKWTSIPVPFSILQHSKTVASNKFGSITDAIVSKIVGYISTSDLPVLVHPIQTSISRLVDLFAKIPPHCKQKQRKSSLRIGCMEPQFTIWWTNAWSGWSSSNFLVFQVRHLILLITWGCSRPWLLPQSRSKMHKYTFLIWRMCVLSIIAAFEAHISVSQQGFFKINTSVHCDNVYLLNLLEVYFVDVIAQCFVYRTTPKCRLGIHICARNVVSQGHFLFR